MFRSDAIKRKARKEAWYGEGSGYNPFRKTTRSSSWSAPAKIHDEERDVGYEEGGRLSNVQTEPIAESPTRFGDEKDAIPVGASHTTATGLNGSTSTNRTTRASDPDSESALKPTTSSTKRPPSIEQKARTNFIKKFFKKGDKSDRALTNGSSEEEEVEKPAKKRPWYKGKPLKHEPYTLRNQLQRTIFNSWINILLIAAPVGIALHFAKATPGAIFAVNFIAIIPLAGLLSFATEEISLHVGENIGGLLNASFGNAVELIVSIIALFQNKIVVVQTSLIGSILSNLLLVMGMCFFFGGLRREHQNFNETVAQTAASLLALAIGSIIVPTAFDQFSSTSVQPIAALSRGAAVILFVVYLAYLYFQLSTHSQIFQQESVKVPMRPRKNAIPQGGVMKGLAMTGGVFAGPGRAGMENRPPNDELIRSTAYEDQEEEPEEPQLHIAVAWATLAIATAIIGWTAEYMVDAIDGITDTGAISVEFVGLILLPIVGNAAEHATAVTVACKDKMDLAIGVAVGSSMQIALLVIPLTVIIGWIAGKDCMTLDFDGFQVAVMFVAVLLVNYLIADGKSHWLEGFLLQCLYFIIAVCAWYYPQNVNSSCPLNTAASTRR